MILAFYTLLTVVGTGFILDALLNDDDDDATLEDTSTDTVVVDQQPEGLDIVGKAGDDTLTGGEGPDVITDNLGADEVDALGGDDEVSTGEGPDAVFGGEGGDKILGGEGEDLLLGEEGDDKLRGNQDADMLIGGEGMDSLLGDDGDDLLLGAEIIDDAAVKIDEDNVGITPGTLYSNYTTFEEPNAAPDTLDGGRGDDQLVLGAEDSAQGGLGFDDFILGDWIAEGDGPSVVKDFNPFEDVVIYFHDEVQQPNPVLSVDTDEDGNALLLADGVLVSIIENSGAFFTPNLVTTVGYTPPAV